MYEASLADFLQVILIIFLIYFGLKLIFRFFGPAIMRYIFKKIGQKVEKKFREQSGFSDRKEKEEKTSINRKPTARKKSREKEGEYIDYEEID